MTNLLWPGDQRAGELMSDATLLASMVAVEAAWLDALVAEGLAPRECAEADLHRLVAAQDCEMLAVSAEDGAVNEVAWAADNVELTTVGIDIGSSTSHLMFARVHLQRLSAALSDGGGLWRRLNT